MTVSVETVHSPAPKSGKSVPAEQNDVADDQPFDECEDCYYPIETFYDDDG